MVAVDLGPVCVRRGAPRPALIPGRGGREWYQQREFERRGKPARSEREVVHNEQFEAGDAGDGASGQSEIQGAGPNTIRVRPIHQRRPLRSYPVEASAPLTLFAQLGGDIRGHSTDLPMRRRKLVLRDAPAFHPKLDSLAFRQIKSVLVDEATFVFESGHGESYWFGFT